MAGPTPGAPPEVTESINIHAVGPTPRPPPVRERPLLVAAVAILVFLAGLVWVVLGISGILLAHGYTSFDATRYLGSIPSIVSQGRETSAIVQVVVGLAIVVVSVGLWRLSQWALAITLIFLLVELIEYSIAHEFGIPFGIALVLFVALAALARSFR